jgi:hypothetical protein
MAVLSSSDRLGRILRLLLTLMAFAFVVTVLSGSSCSVDDDDDDLYCDDDDRWDDDDDDFDDDDDGHNCDDDDDCCDDDDHYYYYGSGGGPLSDPAEAYRLRQFEIQAGADPAAHPIAALTDIRDFSIFAIQGPGEYGEQHFREFTERVLTFNSDLLGLPARAGSLVFQSVEYLDSHLIVTWGQASPVPADAGSMAGAVFFLFDAMGQLLQIENSTVFDFEAASIR